MGPVITVATSKGGGGKTTLAMSLVHHYSAQGREFTVIDSDRNGTLSRWVTSYYEGPVVRCLEDVDHKTIPQTIRTAARFGLVLVDTAGFENQTAAYAMGCSNLVLVPCMNDRGSTAEATRTAANLDSITSMSERKVPMRVVLSRWSPRGLAERTALADLQSDSLTPLESFLPTLSDFAKMSFTGRLDRNSAAAAAVARLSTEVDTLLSTPTRRQKAA